MASNRSRVAENCLCLSMLFDRTQLVFRGSSARLRPWQSDLYWLSFGKSCSQSGQVLASTGRAKARGLGEWSGLGLGRGLDLLASALVGRVEVGQLVEVGRLGGMGVSEIAPIKEQARATALTAPPCRLSPPIRAGQGKTGMATAQENTPPLV